LRTAGCLEEPEDTLPQPLPRPEPLPRGLEKPPYRRDGRRLHGSRLNRGDSPMLKVSVDSPQLVRLHSDSPDVLIVVFTQHDAQEAGEALKEQERTFENNFLSS